MMTEHEYDFLTGGWDKVKGAAYNEVFEYCRVFGWCAGLDTAGRPVLTGKGIKAVKAYQADISYRRGEAL